MNNSRLIKSLLFAAILAGLLLVATNISTNTRGPEQESMQTRGQAQQFDFESLSQRFLSHF